MGLDMYLEKKETVCYWRKANAIHKWILDWAEIDEDDCRPIEISRDGIQELINNCKEVIKHPDKAEELLPTQDGFFFGSTEYDKYYFDDLKYTIKQLEEVLKENDDDWFQYQSSW